MTSAIGTVSFAAAAALYAASAGLYYAEIVRGARPHKRPSASAWLLGLAALAHTAYVVLSSFVLHLCPVLSSPFFLSIASLVATAIYLAARRRLRLHALGVVVAPIGLMLLLSTFVAGEAQPHAGLPAGFVSVHVFANLCGAALFLLAAGAAVMYLWQERKLKRKRALPTVSLPSLDALDRAAHRFLLVGFPLFTVGLIMGTYWTAGLAERSADVIVRLGLGWATWSLFGAVLLLRVVAGWRGRRAAYGSVVGFAGTLALMLIYLLRPWLAGAGG